MKTPVILRQYKDGEICILFPEDTAKCQTTALFLRPSENGVYYCNYEDVDYHAIIATTRPLAAEAAKGPLTIAQRDENFFGQGRTLQPRQRYSFLTN